jgi:transmembrane sensor
MKSNQKQLKRIAAYLSGQLTDVERYDLELWIKASDENERLFNDARTIWTNSDLKLSLNSTNETDQAEWLELSARLDKIQKEGKLVSFFTAPSILKIAASLILLMGLAYLFVWFSSSPDQPTLFHTEKEMISFYLPDSTHVWLNAHSTLQYDEHFNETERHVNLKGEAYFKVFSNQKNTFIVSTTNTYTQVLGTSFSIREDSAETVLTVVHGTVRFASQADLSKSITVEAKEKALCTAAGEVKKYSNDNTKFSHWIKKDNPVFENEKLYPLAHLKTDFVWRKNAIKQSIIEGNVKSSATVATYQNVLLKITYTRANGKLKNISLAVPGPIPAGGEVKFRTKLHDLLTSTRKVYITVESAEAKSTL